MELDLTGVASYTAAWIDGHKLGETSLVNAMDAGSNSGELWPKIGNYWGSSGGPGPQGQRIRLGRTLWLEL